MERYFQLLKQGKVTPDDIDDYIEYWHETSVTHGKIEELSEFLGMTWDEYSRFVEEPNSLEEIYGTDIT